MAKAKLPTLREGEFAIKQADLWPLLLSAIRYSMYRQTYMPEYCREMYHAYRSGLKDHEKRQMAEEIGRELEISEGRGGTVGAQCDHTTWFNLRAEIYRDLGEPRPELRT